MKHLQIFASLLTPLLVVSGALCQTENRGVDDQFKNQADIAAARGRYVQADAQTEVFAGGPSGGEAYPQSCRPSPRPSRPPRMGYPQRSYPASRGSGNPRHAAIGALIGFGLGAALGAKANTDQHPGVGTKGALLFGGFGAMIGAVAGNSIERMHSQRICRRRDELGSRPNLGRAQHTASARAAGPLPSADIQDSTQSVSEAH